MKKLFYLLLALTLAFSACNSGNQGQSQAQTTAAVSTDPSINLDLGSLMDLVKTSRDVNDIEVRLNQPGGINFCDIDNDGNVDYIRVVEYNNPPIVGYKFIAVTPNFEKQVATIEFNRSNNSAYAQGNPAYYGHNSYYNTQFTLTDWLILNYMFSPHVIYISPYHYGYYRPGYTRYRSVSRSAYYSSPRVSTTRYTTTKTVTSPSYNTNKANIDAKRQTLDNRSLSNQKSFKQDFKTRDANAAPVNSNGFKSKPASAPTASAAPKSSSSSSGKSSWGSSSSSSSGKSSSWGSSNSSSSGKSSSWGSSSSSSGRSSSSSSSGRSSGGRR
jgi:uncharacterized membrane protein YgcG